MTHYFFMWHQVAEPLVVEPLVAEPLVATPDGNRNRSPATPSFQAPEETDGSV